MKRIAIACALVLGFTAVAHAQVDRATLSGELRDPSGAVIAAGTISVTNSATNVTTRATTTADGKYLAVDLRPGRYLVTAAASGFENKAQAIVLEIGQRARLDFTVGVGTLAEEVTVEDARRPLNTEQAALGTVIDQTAIANLPLAIRSWDDLLALVAGVQGNRYTDQGGGTSFGRTGGFNVHGQRQLQNNFMLDGVDNNTISENVQELSVQISRPSIDSIQEFKVVTSPYSAEYGRAPGGAISVTTKSGTNQIRGSFYDYFRNDSLDANDFFSKRAGFSKPDNKQNQFGANLGGPIVKDRAFFFVDYEGTRIKRGLTRLTQVPTADQRAGRFASTIRDPLTGQPFPDNTIPANRFDPVAAAILQLVPPPNQPGANNFFRQAESVDDADRILARLDLKATNNDNLFARYIWSDRDRFIPGAFGGVVDGTGTSAFGRQTIKSNGLVTGWTHIFSPSLVNEFRFSWAKARSDAVQDPFGQAPPAGAQVPGVPNNPLVAGGLAGIIVDTFFQGGGLGRIGSPDFLPKFQHTDQFEFVNTLTLLKGNHQFRFGTDIIAPMKNAYLDIPATRGSVQFRNRFTGNPMADFLLGYVSDAMLTNIYPVDQRHWTMSFFVHDDWKPTRKLTLNLGVRYDFITPALEAQDRQTNFIPEGGGRLVQATGGSLEDRGLVKPDRNNFAPRVGIVFQVNDKTVVRGGYGIFYNLFDRVGSEDQLALNPPGLINNSVSSSTTAPVFFLRDGFPSNFLTPVNLDPAAGQLRRLRIRAVSNDAPKTTIHQTSVGVQRELFGGIVLSLDGILTWGRNLASLVNLNQNLPGTLDANGPLPYPNFGFIEWRAQDGKSNYKGLDLTIERRFRRGYGFGIAYTLSESRDNTAEHLSAFGSPSFPQIARNLDAWEGPSDYDVRHRGVFNFVGELPFGPNKKWARSGVGAALLENWTFSAIFTAQTGRPFTVTQSSNNVGQAMNGLPDLVGDPEGPKTVDRWFDPAAFQLVPSGKFGNEPRNVLRGAGYNSFDFSLSRRINLGSRVGATLRWDVFNVFDRTNFGLPNRNIAAANVGTITVLGGDPRLMQLSVRLSF